MPIPSKLYSYSRCGTCKKAIKWLNQNDLDYELIDIIQNPPSQEILIEAKKQIGNRQKLFNTSGLSYRELGAAVVKSMSDMEAIDALKNNPKLIKRPLLITSGGKLLVGFNQEAWSGILMP